MSVLALLFTLFTYQTSFAATDLSSYYNYKNPYTTNVYGTTTKCSADDRIVYSAPVKNSSGKVYGTVYLHYSNNCHAAWGKVVLVNPAPYNTYALASLTRYKYGKLSYSTSCDYSDGGNGVVDKGQTSCYTGMLFDQSTFGYVSEADAHVYGSNLGGSIAYGKTARY